MYALIALPGFLVNVGLFDLVRIMLSSHLLGRKSFMVFLHQRLVEVADMQPMYAQSLPKAIFSGHRWAKL